MFNIIFNKMNKLAKKGADLIIGDCSRYNFFDLLKIKNPFVPAIEWYKHQTPETWIELLMKPEFIFQNPKIRWQSFNSTRRWGSFLFGNKLASYFLSSYFYINMKNSLACS